MLPNYDRLAALLVDVFEVAPDEIVPEAPLAELGIDSLGVEELYVTIHSRLGLLLEYGEAGAHMTVGDVCRLMDATGYEPTLP
ncbi:acyl carrier protein [Streptomyces sp. NPDC020362]|uniref:acyl carrier protein n=1 Tax=unclassified Streptomyces TaxID=2593676 RepID=UPI000A7EA2A5